MASADRIREEFDELSKDAHEKRSFLFDRAHSLRKLRSGLRVASGLVALLSGTAATAIFAHLPYIDNAGMKILSSVMIFASGLLSLFLDAIASPKEIDAMYEGTSKFLSLRDRAYFERDFGDLSKARLEKLRAEYIDLSTKYDHYIGPRR
jgi:hypothetical protein